MYRYWYNCQDREEIDDYKTLPLCIELVLWHRHGIRADTAQDSVPL